MYSVLYGEARGALDDSRTWRGSTPAVGKGFPEHVKIFYCCTTYRKFVSCCTSCECIFLRKIVKNCSRELGASSDRLLGLERFSPIGRGGVSRARKKVC